MAKTTTKPADPLIAAEPAPVAEAAAEASAQDAEVAVAAEAPVQDADVAVAVEVPVQDAALLAAADTAAVAAEKAGDSEPKRLIVRAAAPTGRRRAGFSFHPEPTELLIAELSEEQLELILGDPQLSVSLQ